MKIKFLKSPSGKPFNLGYFKGDEVDIKDKDLCEKLIKAEIAVEVKKTSSRANS